MNDHNTLGIAEHTNYRDEEFDFTNVTVIGMLCFWTSNLHKVVIPSTLEEIHDEAFKNCVSLTEVEFVSNENMGIRFLAKGLFYGCKKLKCVKLPDTLQYLQRSAFHSCSSLENIVLPQNLERIGDRCFYGCKKLRKIVTPKNVTNIDMYTFSHCSALFEVIMCDVIRIDSYAFNDCDNLRFVTFSKYSISLESKCFNRCKKLAVLKIPLGNKISSRSFAGSGMKCIMLDKRLDNFRDIGLRYIGTDNNEINIPNKIIPFNPNEFWRYIRVRNYDEKIIKYTINIFLTLREKINVDLLCYVCNFLLLSDML